MQSRISTYKSALLNVTFFRFLVLLCYLLSVVKGDCQGISLHSNTVTGTFSAQPANLQLCNNNFFSPGFSVTTTLLNRLAFHSLKTPTKVFDAPVVDTSDRDGDGVVDSLDKCPDEKGVIQYDGCPVPDSDNDGVADDSDQCPTVAGTVRHNGCPPTDRDGDKINDDEDKCPDQPGVARYEGCLVKDSDGDGVNDDDDKCINVPGTLLNLGCPGDKPARSCNSSIKNEKRKKGKAS